MALIKSNVDDVNGLEDVIIAMRDGFMHRPGVEEFVQIICVRNCHWITISNLVTIEKQPLQVCVYDSLQSLSVKVAKRTISYPVQLEMDVFQLLRPKKAVSMCVMDVQQQKGGDDCGLFAIAYAALLSQGKCPWQFSYNQEAMRPALIEAFNERDMNKFVEAAVTPISAEADVLYQWVIKLYCSCRAPDDGNEMQECSGCKEWFHKKCDQLDPFDDEWMCYKCKKTGNALKAKALQDSLCIATKNHSATLKVQGLYNAIKDIVQERLLTEDAATHIGCMTLKEYNDITKCQSEKSKLGLCEFFPRKPITFFIVIFHEENITEQTLLDTVIHELAHAVQMKEDPLDQAIQAHGRKFKQTVKRMVTKINKRKKDLPLPFSNLDINYSVIAKAKEVSNDVRVFQTHNLSNN